MRVIEPFEIGKGVKKKKGSFKRVFYAVTAIIFASVLTMGAIAYTAPLKPVEPQVYNIFKQAEAVDITWPGYGQAAIGALGYGVLDTNNADKPVPMASTSKLLTALAVLKQKPLSAGETGPQIPISAKDTEIYNYYLSRNGSVVGLGKLKTISQYHALEAMLLPSANNVADMLVNWAFGSVQNYTLYANNMAKSMGLDNTIIADASGLSPETKSTAADVVKTAEYAIRSSIIAEIAAKKTASIPGVGLIRNTNRVLGINGINGLKTGNTDEAGGCTIITSNITVDGKTITAISAVLGATNVTKAAADSIKLTSEVKKGFKTINLVKAGQSLASYRTPWGQVVNAKAASELNVFGWAGHEIAADIEVANLNAGAKQELVIGSVKYADNRVDLVIDANLEPPDWKHRLYRWL